MISIVLTRVFSLVSQSLPPTSKVIEKITSNCIKRLNRPKKPNIMNLENVGTPCTCTGPAGGIFQSVRLGMLVIYALKQYQKFIFDSPSEVYVNTMTLKHRLYNFVYCIKKT